MSDVLERATQALRDEPIGEDDRTLARILASVGRDRDGDALLDEAIGAMQGEPRASADAERTRRRIESSLSRAKHDRRGRWAIAAAALIAAALVAPTAWAWGSEGLARWLGTTQAPRQEPPAPSREGPSVAPLRAPRVHREPAPIERPPETTSLAEEPAPPSEPLPSPARRHAPAPLPEPQAPEIAEESVPSPADTETLAFRDAHRAHFEQRDFEAALEAWDRYLVRYPQGRYLPEARYNRALALVHLGRLREARVLLARFAGAAPGAYRQSEAAALVSALDARIAAQSEH